MLRRPLCGAGKSTVRRLTPPGSGTSIRNNSSLARRSLRRFSMRILRAAWLAALLLVCARAGFPQSFQSSIAGTVSDATGCPAPDPHDLHQLLQSSELWESESEHQQQHRGAHHLRAGRQAGHFGRWRANHSARGALRFLTQHLLDIVRSDEYRTGGTPALSRVGHTPRAGDGATAPGRRGGPRA